MKKIIIIALIFLGLTSSNSNINNEWATIHCKPNLQKCIQNLNHLELWLELDFKDGKISKERLDQIVERTKKGGAEIVKYLESGSAFYAPAASGVEMAESYLKDLKKQLPCAAFLNGEYNTKGLYAGVPVIIGSKGVEKILEINLNNKEKQDFEKSIKAVNDLFEAAVKIDKDLKV